MLLIRNKIAMILQQDIFLYPPYQILDQSLYLLFAHKVEIVLLNPEHTPTLCNRSANVPPGCQETLLLSLVPFSNFFAGSGDFIRSDQVVQRSQCSVAVLCPFLHRDVCHHPAPGTRVLWPILAFFRFLLQNILHRCWRLQ